MANKLKLVFSEEMFSLDGKINFSDNEAYHKFMQALNAVQSEGKTVNVDGVLSIETAIRSGDGVYPFSRQDKIKDLTIGPSVDEVSLELDTEFGSKELRFERYYTNDAVVLQTPKEAIVYMKMIFGKGEQKFKFTYQAQPEKAKSVKEVLEAYSIVLALMKKLFKKENDESFALEKTEDDKVVENMESFFQKAHLLYQKLDFVEQELGIVFDPVELTQDEESRMDLEELYIALKEKKVIRLNAKLTETEATGIVVKQQEKQLKIGSELDITFVSSVEYSLWGNKVVLYTANLLSNAIVKEIREGQNGELKILYGNEDSRPMYISYRGFKSEEEAKEEMKHIMERKDIYSEALTVYEYIRQHYNN